MKPQPCTEDCFLRDVAQHQMTIELDQGVHRSIRFGRPGPPESVIWKFSS